MTELLHQLDAMIHFLVKLRRKHTQFIDLDLLKLIKLLLCRILKLSIESVLETGSMITQQPTDGQGAKSRMMGKTDNTPSEDGFFFRFRKRNNEYCKWNI
jgi:hypothetical protein